MPHDNELIILHTEGLCFSTKTEGIGLVNKTKTFHLGNCVIPLEGIPEEPLPTDTQYHREELLLFFEDFIDALSSYDPATGVTWVNLAVAALGSAPEVVTVGNRMIFTGSNGPIRITDDPPNYLNPNYRSATVIGGGASLNQVAYSPTLNKVIAGAQAHPSYFGVQSTDNGLTWSKIGGTTTPPRGPVVWCPAPWNMFVCTQQFNISGYSASWYYSADGINWTLGGPSPIGYSWLEYINGVVIAGGGPIIYMDLARIASEGPGALSFVASGSRALSWITHANNGSRVVIGANVSSGFNHQYSDDGINWSDATSSGRQVLSMAWTGTEFICSETLAGGWHVGRSSDGITWSFESKGISGSLSPAPAQAIGVCTASDGLLYLFAPSSNQALQVYSPPR